MVFIMAKDFYTHTHTQAQLNKDGVQVLYPLPFSHYLLILSFVSTYMHSHIHMCAGTCGGQRLTSRVFLNYPLLLHTEEESFT